MLYPRETQTREVKDLSGIWNFKPDFDNTGLKNNWQDSGLKNPILMSVPASFNDMTQDMKLRDHIGLVWYERDFFVPETWMEKHISLRVGSASHRAIVWINGKELMQHKGGFLPFEADATSLLNIGGKNRITIAVDNTLNTATLPPGHLIEFNDSNHPKVSKTLKTYHDFYNFGGIHRPVRLITKPRVYIKDMTVITDIEGKNGKISYSVKTNEKVSKISVIVLDENETEIAKKEGADGEIIIPNAKLWEPGNAYLYTLYVESVSEDGKIRDIYPLEVGIRTIKVTDKEFLINGKPFYFKGFGKHEDSDIRGKGLDHVINIKDFNLLKWIGANSFRTSHYPYSEEIMQLADRYGIAVIDEAPAVGMRYEKSPEGNTDVIWTNDEALKEHLKTMEELIMRDKNHACVVMWSVANEPRVSVESSLDYFRKVFERTRELDPTRPVTYVNDTGIKECKPAELCDVFCINRYYSWYSDSGMLEVIEPQAVNELKAWYKRLKKPIIIAEYGADTIAGFHQDPPVMFTEEYQIRMLENFHRAFDQLDFVIGEHVWNFADFATSQGTRRIVGNRKGIFTRQRQPKSAAYMLRKRWLEEKK
jgi:beta-glucuronidase